MGRSHCRCRAHTSVAILDALKAVNLPADRKVGRKHEKPDGLSGFL